MINITYGMFRSLTTEPQLSLCNMWNNITIELTPKDTQDEVTFVKLMTDQMLLRYEIPKIIKT